MRFETNSIPPRFSKGGRDRVKVGRAWMLDDNVDWRKAIEIESRVWKLELFTRLPSFPVIHGYEGGGNGEKKFWGVASHRWILYAAVSDSAP